MTSAYQLKGRAYLDSRELNIQHSGLSYILFNLLCTVVRNKVSIPGLTEKANLTITSLIDKPF